MIKRSAITLYLSWAIIPVSLYSDVLQSPPKEVQSSNLNNISSLEQRIGRLKDQLYQDEIAEINEEVEGQNEMIAEWGEYGLLMKNVRQRDLKQKELRRQIQELEEQLKQRKKELLQEDDR